ncbi:hypothetical protein AAGK40_26535, partial [Klebsiella pneumoniae]
ADRNRSHWSTSKTPSYTKSVSWQHHPLAIGRIHFPLLSLLGEMSMIIYLLHILVASGSRVILIKVLHVNDWIAHLTIGLLAGIIIPILIYRYIKNTKLKYLFSL